MNADLLASHEIQNKVMFDMICARYFLGHAVNFINQHNNGRDNPYHNSHHCFEVARIAHAIASTEFELTYTEMRGLLIGCLMHDFDHTAADVRDEVNIAVALRGLERLTKTGIIDNCLYSHAEVDIAKRCIEVTEFPFTCMPSNAVEFVIRDADLIYATSSLSHISVLSRLHAEVIRKRGNESMPFFEFVKMNTPFLDSCKWFTVTGETLYTALRDHVLAVQSDYFNVPNICTI